MRREHDGVLFTVNQWVRSLRRQGHDASQLRIECSTAGTSPCSVVVQEDAKILAHIAPLTRGHIPQFVDCSSFVPRLQRAANAAEGMQLHHEIISDGKDKSPYFGSFLIQMYLHSAALEDAGAWFAQMCERNVFSWNLMMGACLRHYEGGAQVLHMFSRMQQEGMLPNKVSYVHIFSACASEDDVAVGLRTLALIMEGEFELEVVVVSAAVNMYAKCNCLGDAIKMFDRVVNKDVGLWNSLIAAHSQRGHGREALQLFQQMQAEGLVPDKFTFLSILSICSKCNTLAHGKHLHVCIKSSGFDLDIDVLNALVCMYGKCGSLEPAQIIFDNLPEHDVDSWNALATACSKQGHNKVASHLLSQMQQEAIIPDSVTLISVLSTCTMQLSLIEAKWIHAAVVRSGLEVGSSVMNALIHVYGKHGEIREACILFNDIPEADVISWNALITVHVQSGRSHVALQLYEQMHQEGIIPDKITYIIVLPACASITSLTRGKQIHLCILDQHMESDVVISNALINFYGKNGDLHKAKTLFDKRVDQDLVAYNAMIAAYSKHEHGREALELFHGMQQEGVIPDKITFLAIIDVYANEGGLTKLHADLTDRGLDIDVVVGTALVNMYAKCENLERAEVAFYKLVERNTISWNAMLSAYTQNRHNCESLQIFDQMQYEGAIPDQITIVTVLSACSNEASLAYGRALHSHILWSGFESLDAVAGALTNMYAKCGILEAAYSVFQKCHKQDLISWNAIIAGFSQHGYASKALELFSQMQHSGVIPDKVTFLCILSACSHSGLLYEGLYLLKKMKDEYKGTLTPECCDCIIDLLGRVGLLNQAECLVCNMPYQPTAFSWSTLLGACRKDLDTARAENAVKHMFELGPQSGDLYVTLSNIYTAVEIFELA